MNKLPESDMDDLVRQKLEGESYSRIRSQLVEKGLSDEEIKATVREVDDRVLREEIQRSTRRKAGSWYRVGLAAAILGLLLSIGTNAGMILKGTPRWIVYSPFFAGILLMFYGRMMQRKKTGPFESGPDRIRRKRPYK